MLRDGDLLVSPNLPNLQKLDDAPKRILPLVRGINARTVDTKVDWTIRTDFPRIGRCDLESFRGGREIPKSQQKRTEEVPLWGLAHSPGDGRWFWGIGFKSDRYFLDFIQPSGDAGSPNGKFYSVVYRPAGWTLRLRLEATYRQYAFERLYDRIVWLDDRYLIFPATRQQEIVYVCDLATDRRN